jgi:hypothetical protein
MDSYVALKTFGQGPEARYQDFVPLPYLRQRQQQIVLTFFPASRVIDNTDLLVVSLEHPATGDSSLVEIRRRESAEMGDYAITFADVRQWASFRIMRDPGYPYIWIGLWAGVWGIFLRYIPDLRQWLFRPRTAKKYPSNG